VLAGLLAAAMSIQLWLIVFIFRPLIVLHRALFVRQLERVARTDGKTGLLNRRRLARARHAQLE